MLDTSQSWRDPLHPTGTPQPPDKELNVFQPVRKKLEGAQAWGGGQN